MTDAFPVQHGDIAPGMAFNIESSLKINGNIGAGAKISVKKGGLVITGSIGDNVTIKVEDASSSRTTSTTIVTLNGKVVSSETTNSFNDKAGITGLTIAGAVGNNVTLECTSTIDLKSYAGNELVAVAGNSFTAKSVGDHAEIEAGNSVNIETIGKGSKIEAGNSANIANIGAECEVEAGNSVNASTIAAGSKVEAGNSIRANVAHASAKLEAGNKVQVTKYVDCKADAPKTGGTGNSGPRP